MNNQNFAEKLRYERERLGYTQDEVAVMLYMTQSAYSRIESGVTKPSADRLQEIKNLLMAQGFADLPPVEFQETAEKVAIVIRWPWNKYVLYGLLIVVVMMVIDYLAQAPGDFARGFSDGYAGKPDPTPISSTIFTTLLVIAGIYGLSRVWHSSKKS